MIEVCGNPDYKFDKGGMTATFIRRTDGTDFEPTIICMGWDAQSGIDFIECYCVKGEYDIFSAETATNEEIAMYDDEDSPDYGERYIAWYELNGEKYPFLEPDFEECMGELVTYKRKTCWGC